MKCEEIRQFTKSGSYSVDFDMAGLVKAFDDYKRMGLQENPDFQRGHVWTKAQQSAFVEYFLRGGTSGTTIYLNHPRWGRFGGKKDGYSDFTLVDGLQRVTAVRAFLNGDIPVFGNRYIEDFEDDWIFNDVVHHSFTVCINDLKSRAEVLEWYIEMNQGGTPHSRDEIGRVHALLSEEKNKERMLRGYMRGGMSYSEAIQALEDLREHGNFVATDPKSELQKVAEPPDEDDISR